MEKDDVIRVEKEYWGKFQASQINEAVRYYVCEGHKRLEGKSLLEGKVRDVHKIITLAQPRSNKITIYHLVPHVGVSHAN